MGKAIISVWNTIRGAFGKEPISVDFSPLEKMKSSTEDRKSVV